MNEQELDERMRRLVHEGPAKKKPRLLHVPKDETELALDTRMVQLAEGKRLVDPNRPPTKVFYTSSGKNIPTRFVQDKGEADDEYYTTKEIWAQVAPMLPKDKVIWECFYGDGTSANHLRDLGFTVVSEPEDFFKADRGEVLVSNPPFSKKNKVLDRLWELQKPWVMLMPSGFQGSAAAERFRDKLQVGMFHRNYLSFGRPPGTKITRKANSFHTYAFAWGLDLPKDLFWLPKL